MNPLELESEVVNISRAEPHFSAGKRQSSPWEIQADDSYLLSENVSYSGESSIRTQGISESTVESLIVDYFHSYYGKKAAVTQGRVFATVNVSWLQGKVLNGRGYWERLQFQVAYKLEPTRVDLALNAEGWYNSSMPTQVGEKVMGPEELRSYAARRLSEVTQLIQRESLYDKK